MKTVRRTLRLIATSALFVTLLGLVTVSIAEIYRSVVEPLLTASHLTKPFWLGAVIAALIPSAYLAVYGCVAFIALGKKLRKFVSDHEL